MLDTLLVAVVLLIGRILLSRRVRDNRAWRATITPLASIIGSGFLVIVPLLANAVGGHAPAAMAVVVTFAFLVGSAIRYNIRYAEPLLENSGTETRLLTRLDRASGIALGFSYMISVTFYLRLLASFATHGLGAETAVLEQVITSAILASIAIAGWIRGLSFLERLEQYSVSIKLAIIAALIVAWGVYDVSHIDDLRLAVAPISHLDGWQVARLLAGLLIVVQGFETSRYLGDEYNGELRIVTMRRAQVVTGLIYVLFVLLTLPTFQFMGDRVDETTIIDLSKIVATVLPPMLVVAALMSQFSAAVADTVGAGGLFFQSIGKRFAMKARVGYALVAVFGITLVWTTDIFQIIALASRSFALYYALQCAVAALTARRSASGSRRLLLVIGFGLLAVLLLACAIVAIPAL
jgi:hypothetical protein